MIERVIDESNLSTAWARALKTTCDGGGEVAPLVVSITGFDEGQPREEPTLRRHLDRVLAAAGHQTVETVANTIFPYSLWNRAAPRSQLFDRYARISQRVKSASTKNVHGIYFDRMITGGPKATPNQLEFVIDRYSTRRGFRRSVLQIATFDPCRDHSSAALRGFPCLQHVTFAPTGDELHVNAFYATQYMVERAYGNYLGLCRLGEFAAHELGLRLSRVTCFTGLAQREGAFKKKQLAPILRALDRTGSGVGRARARRG